MIRSLRFYTFDGVTYRPGAEIPQAVYDEHKPAHVERSDDDADGNAEKPLAKMTTAELKAVAEAEGIDLSPASKNAQRVELIETARLVELVLFEAETSDDPAASLDGRTVDELAAVASALDIEGRSDMDKAALVEALAAEVEGA